MKVLTKEEEQAHYNATVKGGTIGGVIGTAIGGVGVMAASRRFAGFRALTLPFRAFLVASTGTFIAVIAADRASAKYDTEHTPEKMRQVQRDRAREEEYLAGKSIYQRAKDWAGENRYPIIFAFWIASMGGSLALVSKNRYQSGSQKLVQARMYAQGSTLAVLLFCNEKAAYEMSKGKGRWETIKVLDPNDPEHKHLIEKRVHHERYAGEDQWREMVEAEERRMNERKAAAKAKEAADSKQEAKSN